MNSGRSAFKVGAVIAGVACGVVVGYIAYIKQRRKQVEDTDEGIGDVDSIISEGEVEEAALSRIPSNLSTRFSTSESKTTDPSMEDTQKTNSVEEFMENDILPDVFPSVKILVLGLDGCGKTSMLNLLASKGDTDPYQPTTGFNAVQVEKDNLALTIVEVGGNATTRLYWKNFMKDCNLLVYVVDGADKLRFEEAKNALKDFLDASASENVVCLLVSNKQDLDGACRINEVFSDDDIEQLAKKGVSNITLLNTVSVVKSDGTTESDVIMQVMLGLIREQKLQGGST